MNERTMNDNQTATGEMDAKALARSFHNIYEALAPKYGYETRAETRQFNPKSPNGQLMIATCGMVLEMLRSERTAEVERLEAALGEKLGNVTRFEVIGPHERLIVLYDVSLEFSYQDDGRTLKIFTRAELGDR